MKRNPFIFIIGSLLLLVFVLLLFVFQVRTSQVAVVTTFGKPTRPITQPGAYFKWPWPVQKVHSFDQRVQTLRGRFEETLTADGFNLLVMVHVGWQITEPEVFFPRFANGSIPETERTLEALVRSAKNEIVGQHPFAHFIATDEKQLKFAEMEQEILQKVRQQVQAQQYGVDIRFVGFTRLGLPESVTQTVFERMQSERQILISQIEAEGTAQAEMIRAGANRDAARLVAEGEAEATRIRGEGEAKAAESFSIFQQNPDLANLILRLNALEVLLKDKATLILDQNTPGLDLLQNIPGKK